MKIMLVLLLITVMQMSSSTPVSSKDTLQPFELAMLDKLHQPWFKPDIPGKPEYPRKGETLCKGRICKVKKEGCEDCQYSVPLEFERKLKSGFKKI